VSGEVEPSYGAPWWRRPTADFLILGFGAAAAALSLRAWPWWLLLWPALAWIVIAGAFRANRPDLLGKRPEGGRPLILTVFFGPYLAYPRVLWLLKRIFGVDPVAHHEVGPGLWLGRRPLAGERAPRTDIVVDLAAECGIDSRRFGSARYVSLPALNKLPPPPAALRMAVSDLAADRRKSIFVFCSAGKGRSATFAAGILVARGLCASASEAEAHLAAIRPGVRLHPGQKHVLLSLRSSADRSAAGSRPLLPPTAAAGS